ncbi:MAG: L,D-transpeptidase family protein [Chitinophagaceae bacterium]|nr:L,D-transpeptidase family protein [Chitinophagaceae bacterium]
MKTILLFVICLLSFTTFSQTDSAIQPEEHLDWYQLEINLPSIIQCLDKADSFGLDKSAYDFEFINGIHSGSVVLADTQFAMERIMKAVIKYANDVLNGEVPEFSFNGLKDQYKRVEVSHTSVFSALSDVVNYKNDILSYGELVSLYINLKDSVDARLSKKKKGIDRALKTVRWMDRLLKQNEFTIVVNVPSASLLLYNYQKPILESKVIVGKRTTRTPIFASTLSDITIFPYWMVPKSIATKELLPEIKKDVTYLERNNFQVVDGKGRIVDPNSINWSALSREYFPYTIRQSTGCDNSLGLIKLNIFDPFNVYLHDTPWKALFESQNRFFSHGCVRVQKAQELSAILLQENRIAVDTLDESKLYIGKKPKMLAVKNKVPVLILYNIAWFDIEGTVRLYPDIYSKF